MNYMRKISPHKQGLSLIEAVIAMLFIGISVTALLSLQGTIARSVYRAHALIERIPLIKNMFSQADKEKFYTKQTVQEKKIDDPPTILRYTITKAEGPKFNSYPHLYIEKVEASWAGITGTNRETQIMFRFYPKVKGQ